MAYTKTNWVNGYTPLNASNMNKIEEGIYNNDTFLSSLNVRVEDLEGSIGQGGIESVVVSGNGNALTNASYNPSTKILNFEKNNTFALDSDLDSVNDKNLYHLGAYDSVSGNVITRQTGYIDLGDLNWIRDSDYFAVLDFPSKYGSETCGDSQVANIICSRYQTKSTLDVSSSGLGISITSWNALYAKDSNYTDVNSFKTSLQGVILQYKLATPYTETIIEDRPLNTLDQSGSQWIREEWEKGLNLCSSFANESYKFIIYGNLKPNTTYHFTTNDTTNAQTPIVKIYSLNGTLLQTYRDGIYGTYLTNDGFITDGNVNGNVRVEIGINKANSDVTRCMLNEGSHPYPYQQYQGGIVRESQAVKVKEFRGDTSTFNDFTSWVVSNNERIISIMYYENASGSHNYYNVIFGSDGSVFKFINSEETLESIRAISSGSEGADILKIYYI